MLVGMSAGGRKELGIATMVAFELVVFCAEKTGRMHINPGDRCRPVQIDLLYKSAVVTNPDVTLTALIRPETDLSQLQFPYWEGKDA